MKKRLSNHTKFTLAFLSVILLFFFIIQVIAQATIIPPNPGHNSHQIKVIYNNPPGTQMTLQDATNNIDARLDLIETSTSSGSGGNGLETLTGFEVQMTAYYDYGSVRRAHYKVLDPTGTQIHPISPCTSNSCPYVTTPQTSGSASFFQSEIHDTVISALRTDLNFQQASQAIGKSGLIYFKIANYAAITPCQGFMCSSWSVTDINFDLEYVANPTPGHFKFECPSTCDRLSSSPQTFASCSPDLPIQNQFDPTIGCCTPYSNSCKPDYVQL